MEEEVQGNTDFGVLGSIAARSRFRIEGPGCGFRVEIWGRWFQGLQFSGQGRGVGIRKQKL